MSSGNYKTDKINQMLRQRKAQRKKVDMYRSKRIKHKFNKLLDEEHENQQQQAQARDEKDSRKIQFYNSVFGASNTLAQPAKSNNGEKRKKIQSKKQEQQIQHQNVHDKMEQQQSQQILDIKQNRSRPRQKHQQKHQTKWQSKERNYDINKKSSKNKNQISFLPHQKQSQETRKQKQQEITNKLNAKVDKLKQKKKKLIRKMDQRNKKGQPIMNNYVKYALTKLQQTMTKEKLQNHKQTTNQNIKFNKFNQYNKFDSPQRNNNENRNYSKNKFAHQQNKYQKFEHKKN